MDNLLRKTTMKLKKILLLENNKTNSLQQSPLLQHTNYHIDTAPSSLMALQMLDSSYDIIILGKRPRDLSNQQLTHIIRQHKSTANISILSATAFKHRLKKNALSSHYPLGV